MGVTGVVMLCLAPQAWAQEGAATPLDPISVTGGKTGRAVGPDTTVVATRSATGTKTDTPILDTAASVSVVTQKELENRGVKNLQEAVAYTAGVVTDEYGSDNRYDYIRIRGFDQTALGTYRDGLTARIPAWFTASRIEPYGQQRVEILKGSTSTLFGLNGPGGLVNAITKRPQDTFQAETYTTLGEGHREVGADVTGPLDADGVWTYRMTGLYQDGDYGFDHSNDDRLYLAPALTVTPQEGTSLTLLTDYSKRDGTGARGYPAGTRLDPGVFLGEPDFNHFDTKQADFGWLFEHEFGDGFTFRQNARYSHISLDYEEVYGASVDPTANREAFAVYGNSNRFVIDNQLQYDADWSGVETKTLVGLDYAYDHTAETILYGTAGGLDITDPVYCGRACITLGPYVDWTVRQNAVGLYAQEQLTFAERWIVTLGGRFDRVHNTADYHLTGTSDDTAANAFTKRAGLAYKVTDGLALYANYSESFQPLVAPSGNGYGGLTSLKAQEGTQYEVGVKYEPESFEGLFTLALFDLTQSNVPSWDRLYTVQKQIGEVTVRGIEFEGKVAVTDRMNATLAYSYWDPEITGDGNGDLVGNRPMHVPQHIASAWLDYTIPGEGARGDLTLGAGVRYVGKSFSDNANTSTTPGAAVIDAMAQYKVTEAVTLAVNAKNLFDREYTASCYYSTCYYGDRRTVTGTLKYTW
ncbi:TonB-dependent siderophore receptor [Ensifer soli]|uniref:TonB-dependent siderophore receptor n=1 Tax=Ciceribacter sp. sgz301302 TaxID=3342379 RepID=UPI0035BA5844